MSNFFSNFVSFFFFKIFNHFLRKKHFKKSENKFSCFSCSKIRLSVVRCGLWRLNVFLLATEENQVFSRFYFEPFSRGNTSAHFFHGTLDPRACRVSRH